MLKKKRKTPHWTSNTFCSKHEQIFDDVYLFSALWHLFSAQKRRKVFRVTILRCKNTTSWGVPSIHGKWPPDTTSFWPFSVVKKRYRGRVCPLLRALPSVSWNRTVSSVPNSEKSKNRYHEAEIRCQKRDSLCRGAKKPFSTGYPRKTSRFIVFGQNRQKRGATKQKIGTVTWDRPFYFCRPVFATPHEKKKRQK